MLKMFTDESGIDPNSNFCIVAGYLGTTETWSSFEKHWLSALNKPEYKVSCFHAKDAFAEGKDGVPLKEPYKTWGREKTDQFLGELVSVIHSHNLYLVGSATVKSDFHKRSTKERRILTGATYSHSKERLLSSGKPTEPYFCGFTFILQHTTATEQSGDVIEFVFDKQEQFCGWATQLFHHWEADCAPVRILRSLVDRLWKSELVSVIHSHNLYLVGSATVKSDFHKRSTKERRILTGATYSHSKERLLSSGKPTEPYFCGFTFILQHTTATEQSGDVIEFVFDKQEQFCGWATQLFHHWEADCATYIKDRIGGLSFQDKCEFIGLQSADLVAHLWNRYLNYKLSRTRLMAMESQDDFLPSMVQSLSRADSSYRRGCLPAFPHTPG